MSSKASSSQKAPVSGSRITDYLVDLTADRINAQRRVLQKKTVYLGDLNNRNHLTWFRSDAGDFVVKKTSIDNSGENVDTKTSPSPARLSIIALISHRDTFLSPDGNWTEPITAAPSLADVKLSCTASMPERELVNQDFNIALDTIDTMIARIANPQFTRQSFRSRSPVDNKQKIKFRHILFEVS